MIFKNYNFSHKKGKIHTNKAKINKIYSILSTKRYKYPKINNKQ